MHTVEDLKLTELIYVTNFVYTSPCNRHRSGRSNNESIFFQDDALVWYQTMSIIQNQLIFVTELICI